MLWISEILKNIKREVFHVTIFLQCVDFRYSFIGCMYTLYVVEDLSIPGSIRLIRKISFAVTFV